MYRFTLKKTEKHLRFLPLFNLSLFSKLITKFISGIKKGLSTLKKKVVPFESVVADVGTRPKTVAANRVNVYNKTTARNI